MGIVFYDKQGNQIDIEQWGQYFQNNEYKRVAHNTIGDISISTVWLGLDHGFLKEEAPLIFETMVFGGELDGEMNRYSTLEEAEQGHKDMILRVTKTTVK